MKKRSIVLLVFILVLGLMGCGGKGEKAKEETKKETKQTVQKTEKAVEGNLQGHFNHSASMKMTQIAAGIPEVQDPVVVVYDQEGILAYKLKGKMNEAEVEKKIKQKVKAQMPDYSIFVGKGPEWYKQVSVLHQDTIDSEGKVVKDLRKTFSNLKDSNKK